MLNENIVQIFNNNGDELHIETDAPKNVVEEIAMNLIFQEGMCTTEIENELLSALKAKGYFANSVNVSYIDVDDLYNKFCEQNPEECEDTGIKGSEFIERFKKAVITPIPSDKTK